VGYHVYLWHGTSMYWHLKNRIESGLVTADLTTAVVHSYKLLINNVKPVYSHSILCILISNLSFWIDCMVFLIHLHYTYLSNMPLNAIFSIVVIF